MVKMSRYEKERVLIILIVSICVFAVFAFLMLRHIRVRKEKMKSNKSVEKRVEEIHSFYSTKYKADAIVTDMSLNHISSVRLYKDRTKLGFYIEEEPIFTLEIGVDGRNIEPFEVIVFPDKMVELHK